MAAAIEAAITNHRRTQARAETAEATETAETAEAAAISHTFACPYCTDRTFDRDENLWSHVQNDHSQQLKGLNFTRAASKKYRQLVREEALQKAYVSTAWFS